jgi:hypothetical protein
MTTFWVIGAVAGVLLLATVLFGDLLDGFFDSVDFTGGYLSSATVLSFLTAFGLIGGVVQATTSASTLVASFAGALAGALVGAGAGLLTRALSNGPTAHQITANDYVGQSATVTTSIPQGGPGQIHLTIAGQSTSVSARADTSVATGTVVTVLAVLAPGLVKVTPSV